MHRVSLVVLLFLLPFYSCNNDKPSGDESPINAFYYWQTSLHAFDWKDSLYLSMNVGKIYYRFFDVDWSEEARAPVPVSPLELYYAYNWEPAAEVVPVVFITNETFKELNKEQSAELARQIHRKIMAQLNTLFTKDLYNMYNDRWEGEQDPYQMKSKDFSEQKKRDSLYTARMKTIREIQFDCDWTKSTKEKYFSFLEEAKKLFKEQVVSSTIRLYQYKYPEEAGTPPVKRGMLMCYNAGDIRNAETKNSIFDKREIMSYLQGSNYPLPLDYALPVFEWALLYQDGKLKNILSTSVLRNDYESYISFEEDDHPHVKNDFVYGHTANSMLIRKGDEIRIEQPDMDDVKAVAAWLALHKNNKEAILTLYHLNEHDLKTHSKAIETIFNSF